jgi:alkanesulfonate monooxygenase SsuD/methylene tetrahydromethanopterin reductase-like flavin-dependent oxidoreductase (luciferase family)
MSGATQMQFGWLAEQRLAASELLEATRMVERLGFDSVWLSDHFADENGRWMLDPWTTLGAILASVPRITAGTLVASNTLRSPLMTAHMARTLADIAPGRFVLGLGAGGSRSEHELAGVEFDGIADRVRALGEACELIARITAGAGPQDGRECRGRAPIPLVIGGGGSHILRLAGRLADRWAIWGDPMQLASRGAVLSSFAFDSGRQPEDIQRSAIVMLLPEHIPERLHDEGWPGEMRGDEMQIATRLDEYAAAGVHEVIVCDYGVDPAWRAPALEWFASVMNHHRQSNLAKESRS